MIIDSLNLNHLRVFECVFRTSSMTLAAQELHLTQSGVSQHIKSLEDTLQVRLFDRIKQRLIPTSPAKVLFGKCSEGLLGIEHALSEIRGGERILKGMVSVGMPTEFGNNVIMALLAQFAKKYPMVKFKIRVGLAPVMNNLLLQGELDFAFIDSFAMDRHIAIQKVYDEILDLCILDDSLKTKNPGKQTRAFFESLDYIAYQDGEHILRMWLTHHLSAKHIDINVRASVMDVQGVARLVLSGLGAGILPSHLVSMLKREEQRLYVFQGCGKPLKNTISVAYLKNRTHSLAASATLKWLQEQLIE